MGRSPASADVFHAIADSNRRAVLNVLRGGEQPVGSLVEVTNLSYSSVSQHLAVLLEAGAVDRRSYGRQRLYRINGGPLREAHEWTGTYERFWHDRLGKLRGYLDEHP